MSKATINAVVIGYGHAGGKIHVPLIQLAPELNLLGVCSSDPEKRQRIAQQIGCRLYDSYEQVLQDPEAELVVLATPNRFHAQQAIAAMNAGKHVLVDKPMCLTSQECQEIISCASVTSRALSVFHNRRWDGDYLTLRHLVESGELGELRWLEMSWQRPAMPRTWKQHASSGGGRLIDLGSHLIDQALQLVGSPVSAVFCRMQHDYSQLDIESHAMLTISFADGRTAVIDTTGMSYSAKPRFRALGTQGTFVKYGMDPQEAALSSGSIDEARDAHEQWGTLSRASGERRVETIQGRWRSYYELLAKALLTWPSGALPVGALEAARVVRILEAAAESAKTGRAVVLNV